MSSCSTSSSIIIVILVLIILFLLIQANNCPTSMIAKIVSKLPFKKKSNLINTHNSSKEETHNAQKLTHITPTIHQAHVIPKSLDDELRNLIEELPVGSIVDFSLVTNAMETFPIKINNESSDHIMFISQDKSIIIDIAPLTVLNFTIIPGAYEVNLIKHIQPLTMETLGNISISTTGMITIAGSITRKGVDQPVLVADRDVLIVHNLT